MKRSLATLFGVIAVGACLLLLVEIRTDLDDIRRRAPRDGGVSTGRGGAGVGLRAADGRLLMGPEVDGPAENELAISLAVGLQRADGMFFGEFARQRMARLCPSRRLTRFDRVWFGGEPRYSITLGGVDDGTDDEGCPGNAVVAEVDWRDASVTAPSADNGHGQPMPWLDEFRAGAAA